MYNTDEQQWKFMKSNQNQLYLWKMKIISILCSVECQKKSTFYGHVRRFYGHFRKSRCFCYDALPYVISEKYWNSVMYLRIKTIKMISFLTKLRIQIQTRYFFRPRIGTWIKYKCAVLDPDPDPRAVKSAEIIQKKTTTLFVLFELLH